MDETLRLSVTAPFAARVCSEKEVRVRGHLIPPNTPIVKALGVSLHDEQHFPEPERYYIYFPFIFTKLIEY